MKIPTFPKIITVNEIILILFLNILLVVTPGLAIQDHCEIYVADWWDPYVVPEYSYWYIFSWNNDTRSLSYNGATFHNAGDEILRWRSTIYKLGQDEKGIYRILERHSYTGNETLSVAGLRKIEGLVNMSKVQVLEYAKEKFGARCGLQFPDDNEKLGNLGAPTCP